MCASELVEVMCRSHLLKFSWIWSQRTELDACLITEDARDEEIGTCLIYVTVY
jgi:hypothetical protein